MTALVIACDQALGVSWGWGRGGGWGQSRACLQALVRVPSESDVKNLLSYFMLTLECLKLLFI